MPKVDEATFIELLRTIGPTKAAKKLGIKERAVYQRRKNIEEKLNIPLVVPAHHRATRRNEEYPQRFITKITDGVALVGSDAHYWPGSISTAHRAFVKFCKDMNPDLVVMNGDALDSAGISRHPPIGWENRPQLVEEIEETKARLEEISTASPNADHVWPLGNHDGRFETRLAMVAPEYAKIHGVHLRDHFPDWEPCWSCWVNDDVVIKHRFKNGLHAPHNNTLWAGRTMVTGHLHSQKVQPITDYNGDRWGVDSGTMADVYGAQFTDYTEDNPRSWRSGFAVLTFYKGRLLQPELVRVIDKDYVDFRGKVIRV